MYDVHGRYLFLRMDLRAITGTVTVIANTQRMNVVSASPIDNWNIIIKKRMVIRMDSIPNSVSVISVSFIVCSYWELEGTDPSGG